MFYIVMLIVIFTTIQLFYTGHDKNVLEPKEHGHQHSETADKTPDPLWAYTAAEVTTSASSLFVSHRANSAI